ncbi:MAG: histidinol-phosphate transaminase [Syntrophomonadaceae bacterium]|nr:histidinol-phosphate transaminase [Syntrophomonadaceae bacterium]
MGSFVERNARPEIFNLKPYVPGKPVEEVERELGITGAIKMASNENPLGPSPLAVAKVQEGISKLNMYPDSACYYLRQDLAAFYDIDEDCFLVSNGSDEMLRLITETFVLPGDEVLFGKPSFSEYEFMALIMGGQGIGVPLKDMRFDLAAIKNAITDRTKLIYICNPNNPTGTIVSRQEIDQFMEGLPEHVLVIFDEAYFEYITDDSTVSGMEYLARGHKNVIVLRTFSKAYGLAGLRIGYGITTPEIVAAVNRVSEPFNVNLLAQLGAIGALADSQHIQASRNVNIQGRDYLYREFETLGMNYVPTSANFIFVDLGRECRPVFKALMKEGVIVRTGDIFGFPTYIRVTIGKPEENEKFIRSLKKVMGV